MLHKKIEHNQIKFGQNV